MKTNSDSVTIEKFFLRGDIPQRQQLLDGFDQQYWVGQDSQRIYVIRRIEVSGPWWQVSQQAAERVRTLACDARSVDDASAMDAEAVYFISHAHLYARLCLDLAHHRGLRWYWKTYKEISMNSEQAIAGILADNIFYLPKILALLEEQNAVGAVLSPLGADALEKILAVIGERTGWSAVFAKPQLLEIESAMTHGELLPYACTRALRSWRQIVEQASPRKRNALVRLISAVMAWRYAPKILNKKEQLALWQIDIEKIVLSENTGTVKNIIDQEGAVSEKMAAILVGISKEISQQKTKQPISNQRDAGNAEKDSTASNVWDRSAAAETNSDAKGSHKGAFSELGEFDQRDSYQREFNQKYHRKDEASKILGEVFFSQNAGIFFLINAFQQLKVASIFTQTTPSLWHVLYRFCLRLKIDLDDAMQDFLALHNNLSARAQLSELKALEAEDELIAMAEKRFAQHEFWPRSIMLMPGHVCFSESHLDVYFNITLLRLDIRLAGLDINPGWIPWLGRVVTFHYGQEANPHGGDFR